jgi:hypothetical protein
MLLLPGLVACLASVVPLYNVIALWNLPFGSEIRPMYLGSQLVTFGLCTPAIVIGILIDIRSRFDRSALTKRAFGLTCAISVVLSMVPAFVGSILTLVIIHIHGLVLLP